MVLRKEKQRNELEKRVGRFHIVIVFDGVDARLGPISFQFLSEAWLAIVLVASSHLVR